MKYTYLDIKIVLVFLMIFIALAPYFVWGYYAILMSSLLFSFLLTFLYFKVKFDYFTLLYFILVYFVVFLYQSINNHSYNFILTSFIPAIIACLNKEQVLKVFKIFKNVFGYILFPGAVIWVVHLITGNNKLFSFSEIPALNNPGKIDLGISYYLNLFSVVPSYDIGKPFYRFCGIFEEPGVVGTVCALILVADRFKLKSLINKLVFFYGLISFSLMFYIAVFIYLLILSLKSVSAFFKFILLMSFIIISINYTSFLDDYLVSRVSLSGGSLGIEDNRSNYNLDSMYDEWKSLNSFNVFLFGYDTLPSGDYSSIKIIPVNKGLIGIILFLLFIMMLILKFSGKKINFYELFAILIIFGLSLYQRPGFLEPYFIICFCYALIGLNIKRNDS